MTGSAVCNVKMWEQVGEKVGEAAARGDVAPLRL